MTSLLEPVFPLIEATPRQRALRAVVAAGPVVAVLTMGPAGLGVSPVVLALVVALGVAAAVTPDSQIGTMSDLVVVGWWLLRGDHTLSSWSLLAAAALAAGHVAAVLTAYAPPRLDPEPALLRLWSRRWLLLLVPALAALLLGRGLGSAGGFALLWPVALLALVVVVLVVSVVLRPRE